MVLTIFLLLAKISARRKFSRGKTSGGIIYSINTSERLIAGKSARGLFLAGFPARVN